MNSPMKSLYDFIIFEHSGLRNHFVDLIAIGKMLHQSGYKVAIANVTSESTECKDANLPIINLEKGADDFNSKKKYMRYVIRELSPLTMHFYIGSLLSSSNLNWLKYIPSHQKAFIWLLRSFFLTFYKRPKISRYYPLQFINSIRNRWRTLKQSNICFFVSDPIIMQELEHLGYNRNKMVLRPERTTSAINPVKSKHNTPLSILSIGALREEKRLDLCIDALDSLERDTGIHLTIAGKAYSIHGYDKMLEQKSNASTHVTRIPHRLSDEEYNDLINSTDYLILCDEKQPGCITNGTMAEALLAGRPIIAPDYDPYKYIIEKYAVGILYNLHDKESFKDALRRATITSPQSFKDGIIKYQKDHSYERVLSNFATEVDNALKF